ncbi:MAG: HTTM domain-containing protein [Bacteroidetes bacterium]|nr:HTTM domain-containing protein [Bacteroidota bacterium]
MRLLAASTYQSLFKPTHPATLGLLRICFGILMVWQFQSIKPYILEIVTNSKFFLTYDYFHWIKPLSPSVMESLFLAGTIAAAMMLVGLLNRFSSLIVFLVWTYMFMLCRGHYTNHYYLFSLVAFWMFMTDCNRWGSIDRLIYNALPVTRGWILGFGEDKNTVPYWQVLVFQVQIMIVYFYGGIAKIGWDWMQGYPMRIWLPMKPWLPKFMQTDAVAIFMSWSGMLFDLGIGWMLMSKRLRWWALPFVLAFHVTNQLTFRTIAGFPHFMAAATLIYFEPNWPENLRIKLKNLLAKAKEKVKPVAEKSPVPQRITGLRRVFLAFLLVYGAWQIFYPFRHFLYPGDPSLTGEGATFAWRMMLTSRDYGAKLKVLVDGQTFYITGESFFHYVNWRQFTRLCRMPKSIHRFAHFIRDEMKTANPAANPEIYGFLIVEYNGRPFRQLMDTTVNLAALPYNEFGHADWVYSDYMEEPAGSKWKQQRTNEGDQVTDGRF